MVFPVESDCGQKEVLLLFLLEAGTPGFSRLMHLAGPSGKSEQNINRAVGCVSSYWDLQPATNTYKYMYTYIDAHTHTYILFI